MSSPERIALAQAYAALCQAKLAMEAAGVGPATEVAPSRFTVPVKTAASVWGVTENAALRRARKLRGVGLSERLLDGRWYFTEAALASGKVRMRPPKTQDAAR